MLKNYQKIHFQTIIVEYLAELDVMWTLIPIYLRLDSNFVFFFVTDKHSKHPGKKMKFINWFHDFLWFSKKKTYFNYYLIHLLQSRSNFFYLGEQSFKLLHQCIMICHHLKKCKQNVLFTYAGYKKIRVIKLLLHINFTKIV